jgi:predicted GNAT superfamily acetyltransferase
MASIELSSAAQSEIDGILALQEENQPEHGGLLSARSPRAWFEAALNDLPIIVARRSGRVVGYLVTASREATQNVPVIVAMLCAYPGASGSYVYGPVCVAADERGHGLAATIFAELRKLLPGANASYSFAPTTSCHCAPTRSWACARPQRLNTMGLHSWLWRIASC